jgi:hypothetical protein
MAMKEDQAEGVSSTDAIKPDLEKNLAADRVHRSGRSKCVGLTPGMNGNDAYSSDQ